MARSDVHPLGVGLADPDEDAGGERDAERARARDGPEAPLRDLVRRAIVRGAGGEQPLGRALEHDPHAHVDLPQRGQIALRHQPRVGVGQETRLVQDAAADLAQVAERRPVAHRAQEGAVLGEERLGLVAQREQGFLGAEPRARAGQGQHLVGRHREGARLARILPERAIAAVVAAERGERDEDLGREGNSPAPAPVAQGRCGSEEHGQTIGRRLEKRGGFRRVGRPALREAVQRPLDRGQLEYCHEDTRLGVTRIMRPRSRGRPRVRYCAYLATSRSTPWANCGPSVSRSACPWMMT